MIRRALMVVWIAVWLAIGAASMLSTIPPTAAHGPKPTPCWEGCHADPTGRIGHPLTGHKPHHGHKPPREHLTMPPTDTED